MELSDVLNPQTAAGLQGQAAPVQAASPTPAPAQNRDIQKDTQGWFEQLKEIRDNPEFAHKLIVFGNAISGGASIGEASAQVIRYQSLIDQNLAEEERLTAKDNREERRVANDEQSTANAAENARLNREQRQSQFDMNRKDQQRRWAVSDAQDLRNYRLTYGKAANAAFKDAVKSADDYFEFADGTPEDIDLARQRYIDRYMERALANLPAPGGQTSAAPATNPTVGGDISFADYAAQARTKHPNASDADIRAGYEKQKAAGTLPKAGTLRPSNTLPGAGGDKGVSLPAKTTEGLVDAVSDHLMEGPLNNILQQFGVLEDGQTVLDLIVDKFNESAKKGKAAAVQGKLEEMDEDPASHEN